MSLITVKFSRNQIDYTWFVSDNWAGVISFLLTLSLVLIYKKFFKKKNNPKKLPNPRGGERFIDECIDPDSVYEIVDPASEIIVKNKKLLKLPTSAGPIIISSQVLIVAYIASQKIITRFNMFGFQFYIDQVKDVGLKTLIGSLSAGIFFFTPLNISSFLCAVLGVSMALNIVTNPISCDDFLSKLPSEKIELVEKKKITISYIDEYPETKPKIYMKGSEKNELYINRELEPLKTEKCYSEVSISKTGISQTPVISRKCKKEYVPLKHRTKTLADIKEENSSDRAEPYIKRYQQRRERIRNNRNQ
jgi:hypothetical protein